MARTHLVALAALCLVAASCAHPIFFLDEYAKTCTSHPTIKDGMHKDPIRDSVTTFKVTSGVTSVRSACPGASYTVTVGFPEPREALVTTTVGTLAAAGGQTLTMGFRGCSGRVNTVKGKAQGSVITTWTVPCSATGAATVSVTSAAGMRDNFRQAQATIPISPRSACPTSKC